MNNRTKLHDGIVGMIYLLSIILATTVNLQWLYLAGAVAILQIMSMFTGFCPVYYTLDKLMDQTKSGAPKTK
ncbi:YgaP family membrane protein [Fodinibius sp. Rm-B-1B1-1]|uniref:YgaP family membrane protein n=1 Tax=Fodinibius alkaliphilus TaxID=3140241 RepID=UPI00315A3047